MTGRHAGATSSPSWAVSSPPAAASRPSAGGKKDNAELKRNIDLNKTWAKEGK